MIPVLRTVGYWPWNALIAVNKAVFIPAFGMAWVAQCLT